MHQISFTVERIFVECGNNGRQRCNMSFMFAGMKNVNVEFQLFVLDANAIDLFTLNFLF